ncbi:hypothetical protein JNUCC1_01455 [Lentibacillus sp. JNUCC-1]|uniref:hypothetical protein n=1 Tax=Lentibacillus sp. JNUCC-1 TaxID=2654513 RepID=UPI0012E8CA7E|nr:hypothetical protein [Lentibacillus sp. JNUCC-1]MUV37649.1 hypothetical protein [Lentibacillus sp. JNUCC-1]
MHLYESYLHVLKKNFMLVIMAVGLMVFTFFLWAGVPVFIVGGAMGHLTMNPLVLHAAVSLSAGFLFAFYFAPINLKVAGHVAQLKNDRSFKSFVKIQTVWIVCCAILFEIALMIAFMF